MTDLLTCPFCGWDGIHMRKKTQMRESVTGLMYMRGYDQFSPISLGFVGTDFREEPCYDYRFGIRFFCGKCRAETPYVWGEWHLPAEDEVETFDDMPHACERFSPEEEQATINKAIAAWNTRTERTCRNVDNVGLFKCSECGHFSMQKMVYRDGTPSDPRFCPWCGAKVVD